VKDLSREEGGGRQGGLSQRECRNEGKERKGKEEGDEPRRV